MSGSNRETGLRAPLPLLPLAAISLAWLVLVMVAIFCRPLLPVDETRYLSVAWEMYRDGDWLVPHLNGATYSHKPPLLFWAIAALWKLFAPLEWMARLVAPAGGLAALWLTAGAARRMWPEAEFKAIAWMAPLVLLSLTLWTLFTTLTMFDCLMALWALLALHATFDWAERRYLRGVLLLALAVGLGTLTKGPVSLIYALTPLIAGHICLRPRLRIWYWLGLAAAGVAGGAAIALTWAVPAGVAGGPLYQEQIFLGQTSGRLVESFAHKRPFWWYLPLLPLLLYPWAWWPPIWRACMGRAGLRDPRGRLCLVWFLLGLLTFSLISGKQAHYLVPLLPALALLFARLTFAADGGATQQALLPAAFPALGGGILLVFYALDFGAVTEHDELDAPDWLMTAAPPLGLALLALAVAGVFAMRLGDRRLAHPPAALAAFSLGLFLISHVFGAMAARTAYDLAPIARKVAELQVAGRPVAYIGNYQGQFNYLGRLAHPVAEVRPAAALDWARANPRGALMVLYRMENFPTGPAPVYRQPKRGRQIAIWDAEQVLAQPGILQ